MPRRSTSLSNVAGSAITREIDSKYDVIKEVSLHLDEIAEILDMDLATLLAELQEVADFEGLTVISGEDAGWDAVNKILTVPTVKGEPGSNGYNGLTPLYEFTYNSTTGNLEYSLVGYADEHSSELAVKE